MKTYPQLLSKDFPILIHVAPIAGDLYSLVLAQRSEYARGTRTVPLIAGEHDGLCG